MFEWFRRSKQSSPSSPAHPETAFNPEPNQAIPACSIDQVIARHGERYRRLRKEMDFAPEEIPRYYDDLILSLAQHIHALPASEHADYRTPAGLLGKCLQTAFLAQRIAHGMVVAAHLPADARSTAERGWRYAAMVAGLIYPVGVLHRLGAKGETHTRIWHPGKGPLLSWCQTVGESSYRPYWHLSPRPHTTESSMRLWMLGQLLTHERAHFIARETDEYLEALIGGLSGTLPPEAPMAQVLARADEKARLSEIAHRTHATRGLPITDRAERVRTVVNLVIEESRQQGAEAVVRRVDDRLCAFWPRFGKQLRVVASQHDILGFSEDDGDDDLLLTWLTEAELLEPDGQGNVLRPLVPVGKVDGPCADGIVFRALEISLDGFPLARLVATQEGRPEAESDQGIAEAVTSDRAEEGPQAQEADNDGSVRDAQRPQPGGEVDAQAEAAVDELANESPSSSQPTQEDVTTPSRSSDPADLFERRVAGGERSSKPLDFSRLGPLGVQLQQVARHGGELGWWTQKGRALPWPETAKQAGVAPKEMLVALQKTPGVVRSSNKQLPLFHEVTYQGEPRTVFIIASEYWPHERD